MHLIRIFLLQTAGMTEEGEGALVLVDTSLQPTLYSTESELGLEFNVVTVCFESNNSRSLISIVYRLLNTSILKTRKLIKYLKTYAVKLIHS